MIQQPIDRPVPQVTSSYAPQAVAQASLAGDLVYPIAPTHHINVTNHVAMPSIHMSLQSRQQPFLLRAIWFLFVGWWLSAIFITVGFALVVLVVTIPFGLYILHRVPQAQTLRQRTASLFSLHRLVVHRRLALRGMVHQLAGHYLAALGLDDRPHAGDADAATALARFLRESSGGKLT